MTDSNEALEDRTARSRMEAMLEAMRRPAIRQTNARAGKDEGLLAAVARQAMLQRAPDTGDPVGARAADAGGGGPSLPTSVEGHTTSGLDGRLGRYLPIEELGRGAMGRVLRAYDPKLQREVALKVLTTEVIDSLAWARTVREARTMAKLNHPHVVAIYDVVEDPRQGLVIAMELVKGTTLQEWLQERPRSWGEVLEAFIEAGRGLAAAHNQGLLHRDFKPANALVARGDRESIRGPVKVTDFGLARRDRERAMTMSPPPPSAEALEGAGTTLTEDGVLVGTPVYMAPEQHRGDALLTTAADQFAFCVALWEALYGERPFGGRTLLEISTNVLEGRRQSPPTGRVIPNRLRRTCERGLAVDPQQRWPSMEALLTELRQIVVPRTRHWMTLGVTVGLATLGGGLAFGQYVEVMDRCTGARTQLAGIWDEARKQEVKTAILATELDYAPGTWQRVEQQLDGYAAAWADKHTEIC